MILINFEKIKKKARTNPRKPNLFRQIGIHINVYLIINKYIYIYIYVDICVCGHVCIYAQRRYVYVLITPSHKIKSKTGRFPALTD